MEWLLVCLTLAVLALAGGVLAFVLLLRTVVEDGQKMRDAMQATLRDFVVEEPKEFKEVNPDPNLGWHD